MGPIYPVESAKYTFGEHRGLRTDKMSLDIIIIINSSVNERMFYLPTIKLYKVLSWPYAKYKINCGNKYNSSTNATKTGYTKD